MSEETQTPKTVIGIIVGLTEDGKRTIAFSSETQNKDEIQLTKVRELLQWGVNHINDTIMQGMVRMELDRAAKIKIVKPGFRPMSMLKSIINGHNGNA